VGLASTHLASNNLWDQCAANRSIGAIILRINRVQGGENDSPFIASASCRHRYPGRTAKIRKRRTLLDDQVQRLCRIYLYSKIQLWLKRTGMFKQVVDPKELHSSYNDYKLKDKDWLFDKPCLPFIDTTVVLLTEAVLLIEEEIQRNLEDISPFFIDSLDFDDIAHTVKPHRFDLRGSFPMASGTKLRILGYHAVGNGNTINNYLFALVLVLKDGKPD